MCVAHQRDWRPSDFNFMPPAMGKIPADWLRHAFRTTVVLAFVASAKPAATEGPRVPPQRMPHSMSVLWRLRCSHAQAEREC